ncbi:tyrosine/serine/threonine protein phosphatase [Friedmanniomyces endolithicus]|uniref:protein-tyrosine-phosphatase n=1 Tax=Friedmanniomyces endolithicus TaxID=329885 RepID=A0AAN6KJI6_9PEZI|nr:tyrosine/serine/threonine protein phosphatase [Friedmanniomyces endolithicus]KAK0827334.1 tyrosine/serine/threonine protein phosphatase [Friedmanniomyces endolithicus]KAK0930752.1 tyrosine/serine/threonine protein phosphatase [Friedmanniomyces endolithicus]KAK0985775.1 tyrosine/serine/threonine protein phosphatase [Friedmanniomyces endolithicus]KAK1014714.1 tyrosine/serine/threonine protein phosphatase [Friedmanniomyces endolithicus]
MPQPDEQAASEQQASPSSMSNRELLPSGYAEKVFYKYHHHSISDSTQSGSNDSSPTTTVSTVDDSSATEASPDSSPESPPPSTFDTSMLRPRTPSDESNGAFFELQKQPPIRKGRNLKNLAVNTSRHTGRAASTTSLPLPLQPIHAHTLPSIASPAFVKPPSPPKRKPSNLGLTLLTPASNKVPPQDMKLAIPPTPAYGRPSTLRHFQSSPSLPILPGFESHAGMFERSNCPAVLDTIISPTEPTAEVRAIKEEEQNFDVPLSREEKLEAYPDGPICVYSPYVDLYLEPSAEQCRQYDVVMNVANEVRNPMVEDGVAASGEPDIRIDGGGGIQFAPRRAQLNVPGVSDLSTVSECSPTTPKATPLSSSFPVEVNGKAATDPEYIHFPWEHNSDIVPDLLRLCKLVDERVVQGKRVLVHCQCGVSRSASLLVAYGLYKSPTLSVQEAYDVVKTRSKWIGPNMNLIMQLQEFRTSLAHDGLLPGNRGLTPITPSSAMSDWRGPFSANPSSPISRVVPLSAGIAETSHQVPVDNELPAVTPGPASAPSGVRWPTNHSIPPVPTRLTRAVSSSNRASAYVDPSGHVIPVLRVEEADTAEPKSRTVQILPAAQEARESGPTTPTAPLASPRNAEFAMTALQPSHAVDSADAFGILSPTTTDLASSPFDRSALLAALGMGSIQPEDAPRRALSLHSRPKPPPAAESATRTGLAPASQDRRLRGKISSPGLREQERLKSLQARIQAQLSLSNGGVPAPAFGGLDGALLSPRATEFTKGAFAFPAAVSESDSEATRKIPSSAVADPRSPAQMGGSRVTWSILDVL